MKNLLQALFIGVLAVSGFTACSESEDNQQEYSNWANRNNSYFSNIRALAHDSMTISKAAHGDAWEAYCNWRGYLSYSLVDTVSHTSVDSIYVQILKRGTGAGSPMGSDSVRVNYRVRLTPSLSYPDGKVISYSGQSSAYDKVFDHNITTPTALHVGSAIRGFSTAIQQMHIGDLWRLYIPYRLGYGEGDYGVVPAYSTLIYEVELRGYYRAGTSTGVWQ